MYLPAHFEETRAEVMHALIVERPLGLLVTHGSRGLVADHIPFLIDADAGEHGTLIAHVARNNALWHDHQEGLDALVVFQGAADYISPTWYPEKQVSHRVVPTWNYAIVHASGPLIVHDDEKWVRMAAGRLTVAMERHRTTPWKMGDAPREYLETMLANIVGIEIPIRTLTGKWKAGQNRNETDRRGAIAGLEAEGDHDALATATLMRTTLGD